METLIIDLYNDIYEGEKMPKHIKYNGKEYKWNKSHKDYMAENGLLLLHNITPFELGEEVEIIKKV